MTKKQKTNKQQRINELAWEIAELILRDEILAEIEDLEEALKAVKIVLVNCSQSKTD